MTDITERLTFWKHTYPEDAEPGAIHTAALKEILYLRSVIRALKNYPTLHNHCIKYLREHNNQRPRNTETIGPAVKENQQ